MNVKDNLSNGIKKISKKTSKYLVLEHHTENLFIKNGEFKWPKKEREGLDLVFLGPRKEKRETYGLVRAECIAKDKAFANRVSRMLDFNGYDVVYIFFEGAEGCLLPIKKLDLKNLHEIVLEKYLKYEEKSSLKVSLQSVGFTQEKKR